MGYPIPWDYDLVQNRFNEAQYYPSWSGSLNDVYDSREVITNEQLIYDIEPRDVVQEMGNPYLYPDLTNVTSYPQAPVHQTVLNNSKPAEFLALRETQGE